MKRMSIGLLSLCIILFLAWACSDSNNKVSEGPHDPTKPIEFIEFMPDSGKIREKVIIKGENFGNDVSKINVVFNDGSINGRKATVIGVNNNTIYCMAPRQNPGFNTISLTIEEKEQTIEQTFKYIQAENVSTIAGENGGNKDGSLTDAQFSYMWGVAAIGNEAILAFQRDNAAVRLVSVPDNKVTTVHTGFRGGKPTVTKDKNTVYAAMVEKPHTIYAYTRGSGWSPTRIGQLGSEYDRVMGVALDESEEWLYFVDRGKTFARFNISSQKIEEISKLDISADLSDNGPYIVYNPIAKSFFLTAQKTFSVYRLEKNGDWEVFAGSANSAAIRDGYGTEAAFRQPNGITVDEDGNMFLVEGHNAYVLRKINIEDQYVSTVAGVPGQAGTVDGNPLEAKFNYPYDIANDGEGNYWIVEGWGTRVRKYAVE